MVTGPAPGDRDPGAGSPDDDSNGMSGGNPLPPWSPSPLRGVKGEGERSTEADGCAIAHPSASSWVLGGKGIGDLLVEVGDNLGGEEV